jgi:hypothetical protein
MTDLKHLVVLERIGAEDQPLAEAVCARGCAAVVLQRDVLSTATAEPMGRAWQINVNTCNINNPLINTTLEKFILSPRETRQDVL